MENEVYFGINRRNMFTDYEFIRNKRVIGVKSDNNYFDHNTIIFVRLNDKECKEVLTGKKFVNEGNNVFYNEDTGLCFKTNLGQSYWDYYTVMLYLGERVFEYIENVKDFFDFYEYIANQDKELIAKSRYSLLKKNIGFTKK